MPVVNLDDPEDREVAAAEFVVGTLAGAERAQFEAALARDPALQRAVYAWQDRLLPLARRAAPLNPADHLWARIDSTLADGRAVPQAVRERAADAANEPLWNRIGTWRVSTAVALAASLLLAILLALRGASSPLAEPRRYLAVLQSPTAHSTGWVVEATAGDRVRLIPIGDPVAAPAGQVLQFWTKPKGATGPTSLGLVRAGEIAVVPASQLPGLGDQQLFELTLEPEGGSTTGRPTGPVLYVGTAIPLQGDRTTGPVK